MNAMKQKKFTMKFGSCMRKWLLVVICILLVGCSKVEEEPTDDLSRYQTWVNREMDKVLPIKEIQINKVDHENRYLKVIQDPKLIQTTIDQLKKLEFTGESTGSPCGGEVDLALIDENNQPHYYSINETCVATEFYPKILYSEKRDMKAFYDSFQVKEYKTARQNPLSSELAELRINEYNILTNCKEQVCDTYGVKSEANSANSLQQFLDTLIYGEAIKRPEKGNTYLLEFIQGESKYYYWLIENEKEIAVGTPSGEWYSVDYFYQSIQSFIAKLDKTEEPDPTYRGEFVYEEGVGRKLEEYGLITSEAEKTMFTSNAFTPMKIKLDALRGQIFLGAKQDRYDYIKDVSDTTGMHGDACSYYPSSQTSKGCTLEEAREEYMILHEQFLKFLSDSKISLDELADWTIELKETQIKKEIEQEEGLDIEKTWIGNVIDIEKLLSQDGYVKKGQYFYKKTYKGVASASVQDMFVVIDPYKMSVYFKEVAEERSSTIPFNSQIGTYQQGTTICDYDFKTDRLLGECASDPQFSEQPPLALAQRAYWSILHRFSLTSEDLIQYSQMIQVNEPARNEPYDFTGL